MGAAIESGIDLVRTRKATHRANGVSSCRPWIFLITDCAPTDSWQDTAGQIRSGEEAKSFMFFPAGVEQADMTAAALALLPGFRTELNRVILDWCKGLERTFVYDAGVRVDPGDIADLDRRQQQERTALEHALRDGPETLQDTARRVVAARTAAKQDVIEAVRLRRQAEADVYVL